MNTRLLSLFILAILFFYQKSKAQNLCEGSLGNNIFTAGDFGAGTANIPSADPGIAPGYTYTTSMPPNDGQYTITNDIAQWSYAFNWLEPQDNSSNPDGYMMVVNASYQPGLFYEQTVDGLCENTTYEFSADIINLIRNGFNAIKPNVSFLIDGQVVFQTGDIPESETWNTYGFSFDTEPWQTSVILALQNNAPGGGGNDLALDNITFRPCGPEVSILPETIANICEDGEPITISATVIGDQYPTPVFQWQQSFDEGATWEDIGGENSDSFTHTNLSSGWYYYRFSLANNVSNLENLNCQVFSNTKIIQVVPKFYTVIDTLCEGVGYEQADNIYALSGIYTDSLISSIGCDSIVTLELTILENNLQVAYFPSLQSCPGANDAFIEIGDIINGHEPVAHVANEALVPPFDLLNPGNYDMIATDRYGCTYEESVVVTAASELVLTIESNQDSILLGEAVNLKAFCNFSPADIQWEPAYLFDCFEITDCLSPTIFPLANTTVQLTASTAEGCLVSDRINIMVEEARLVYIPNVFSPNFDGINDYFTVYGAVPNVQQVKRLTVFDRWGGVLFERRNFLPNDESKGWDGRKDGGKLDVGIYVYLAEVEFLDGVREVYGGDVLLVE